MALSTQHFLHRYGALLRLFTPAPSPELNAAPGARHVAISVAHVRRADDVLLAALTPSAIPTTPQAGSVGAPRRTPLGLRAAWGSCGLGLSEQDEHRRSSPCLMHVACVAFPVDIVRQILTTIAPFSPTRGAVGRIRGNLWPEAHPSSRPLLRESSHHVLRRRLFGGHPIRLACARTAHMDIVPAPSAPPAPRRALSSPVGLVHCSLS